MSSWTLNCPELEIRHTPLKGNHFALNPGIETSIDVLEIHSPGVQSLEDPGVLYKRNLGHEELVEHLDPVNSQAQVIESKPLLRILFIKACGPGNAFDLENAGVGSVRPTISSTTLEFLVKRLGVSPLFMEGLTGTLWRKMGNCQWSRKSSAEPNETIEGWYRYSCGMRGFPSYTWFSYTGDFATYVVNNCERHGVLDRILRCIREGFGGTLLRPLAIDAFISETTSEAWSREITGRRRVLIEHEHMNAKNRKLDTSESIEILHRLSFDLLIIKEDMTDLIERMEFLLGVHSSLTHLTNQTYPGIPVSQSLSFLLSQTGTLRRWVQSYTDRTAIQINLLYNLSSQRDNRTNLRIADFTSKIATETQKDSASMITMSTVTMLFLPGTFVSAVFSMVFFESGVDSTGGGTYITVSRGWWLYPVITIPLTAIVFLVWHTWRARRSRRQLKELKESPTSSMYELLDRAPQVDLGNETKDLGLRPPTASHWNLPPF